METKTPTKGTVSCALGGKFCTFERGEVVNVVSMGPKTCFIEKENWDKERGLPIMNQLCDVPNELVLL